MLLRFIFICSFTCKGDMMWFEDQSFSTILLPGSLSVFVLCRTTAEGHSDQVVLQAGLLSPDGPGWKYGWDQRRQHQLLWVDTGIPADCVFGLHLQFCLRWLTTKKYVLLYSSSKNWVHRALLTFYYTVSSQLLLPGPTRLDWKHVWTVCATIPKTSFSVNVLAMLETSCSQKISS